VGCLPLFLPISNLDNSQSIGLVQIMSSEFPIQQHLILAGFHHPICSMWFVATLFKVIPSIFVNVKSLDGLPTPHLEEGLQR
jgi:hypothetical protein